MGQVLFCGHLADFTYLLKIMVLHDNEKQALTRRTLLKSLGLAPLLLRPAPFYGSSWLLGSPEAIGKQPPALAFADVRLTPHYPAKSPLAEILRLVPPGSDE